MAKFKVGDTVIGNELANRFYKNTPKGWKGIVVENSTVSRSLPENMVIVRACNNGLVGESFYNVYYTVNVSAFDLYRPCYQPHVGKILIMVDKDNENKVVARDLISGKTAEATCSPKDEWDFSVGAKLALERLTEPEKPKKPEGWTGKVVCTSSVNNYFFTIGKIYPVKKGTLYTDANRPWTPTIHGPFIGVDDINQYFKGLDYMAQFIEYKGEVRAR